MTRELRHFLQGFLNRNGIGGQEAESLRQASDHPYHCRCSLCLAWWAAVGREQQGDGTPSYGPFSQQEVAAYKREHAEGDDAA
jgi:hypothetical protein